MTITTAGIKNLPQNIAFIGLGSMAGAIMQGLLGSSGSAKNTLICTTKSATTAAKYSSVESVKVVSLEADPAANTNIAANADLIVIGVKPWQVVETLQEIAPVLKPGTIIVSVAAGITLETMRAVLPASAELVRAMPNTPALIGKGVTGITAEQKCSAAALQAAKTIFAAVGEVLVVPESKIDALSAVSGSGPAYLFWFVEQLTAAAERLGFTPAEAIVLAQNTIVGAAALLETDTKSATEQRLAVTSPNGTTEQAIKAFNAADPQTIFDTALGAAIRRATEIAAEK